MSIYMAAGVLVLILVGFGLRWYLLQPAKYKLNSLDELKKYVKDLYKYYRNGSVLVITNTKTGRFVQFTKYIYDHKEINLHFGYPDAPWSKDYFENVQAACKENDFNVAIKKGNAEIKKSKVDRFLTVDWINPEKAIELSKVAFQAMDLPLDDKYEVFIDGIIE